MNRHLHRVVFNRKRGLLCVVAENTRAEKKKGGSREAVLHFHCGARSFLQIALLASILLLGWGSLLSAQAQIVAAPNAGGANRPVVDNTANGRPLVQIVAPNGAGVSHNQYQQFNVERGGARLGRSQLIAQTVMRR